MSDFRGLCVLCLLCLLWLPDVADRDDASA